MFLFYFRCFQGSTTSMDGGGYLNTRPYSAGLPRARSPIISSVSDISRPVMTSSITASLVSIFYFLESLYSIYDLVIITFLSRYQIKIKIKSKIKILINIPLWIIYGNFSLKKELRWFLTNRWKVVFYNAKTLNHWKHIHMFYLENQIISF